MAFDSGTSNIIRPSGLTELLGWRNARNSWFEAVWGARLIGNEKARRVKRRRTCLGGGRRFESAGAVPRSGNR